MKSYKSSKNVSNNIFGFKIVLDCKKKISDLDIRKARTDQEIIINNISFGGIRIKNDIKSEDLIFEES
jgi:hypothetical protein